MLEFVVLGIVPGTHIQITFSWVMLFSACLLALYELRMRDRIQFTFKRYIQKRLSVDEIAL